MMVKSSTKYCYYSVLYTNVFILFTGSNDGYDSSEPAVKKVKTSNKNPDVDTSFLPDRDREEEENKLREELRQEWVSKQEALKQESIEITYR